MSILATGYFTEQFLFEKVRASDIFYKNTLRENELCYERSTVKQTFVRHRRRQIWVKTQLYKSNWTKDVEKLWAKTICIEHENSLILGTGNIGTKTITTTMWRVGLVRLRWTSQGETAANKPRDGAELTTVYYTQKGRQKLRCTLIRKK